MLTMDGRRDCVTSHARKAIRRSRSPRRWVNAVSAIAMQERPANLVSPQVTRAVEKPSERGHEKMKAKSTLGEAKVKTILLYVAGIDSLLQDVDEAERRDVQACTEYVKDVYSYFRNAEEKYMPAKGYMEKVSKQETTDGASLPYLPHTPHCLNICCNREKAGQLEDACDRGGLDDRAAPAVTAALTEMQCKPVREGELVTIQCCRFRPSLQPATLYLGINVFDRFLASGHMKVLHPPAPPGHMKPPIQLHITSHPSSWFSSVIHST